MTITKNKVVTLQYEVHDKDRELIDSSAESGPLSYIHGLGEIVTGLETALEGRKVGDKITVTLTPEDGYGEYDEELVLEMDRKEFGDEEIELGMHFHVEDDEEVRTFTVIGIEGDKVAVDGNHPLAGETLTFDVTVTGLRDASAEELEHGHIHGEGGHHH